MTKFDKWINCLDKGYRVQLTYSLGWYLHEHSDTTNIAEFINYCEKQTHNKLSILCLSMIDLSTCNDKSNYVTPTMISKLHTDVSKEYNPISYRFEDLHHEFGVAVEEEAVNAWLALYEQRRAHYLVDKMFKRLVSQNQVDVK